MNVPTDPSPWLGGPGARWAQWLLFALHVALLGALLVCAWSFWRILPRVALESWQIGLFFAGILLSIGIFARRARRIWADLRRPRRAPSSGGRRSP